MLRPRWRLARAKAAAERTRVLLVLDEIQKDPGWSGVTKRLWDEDLATGGKVRPLLLGSSALLVQRGLTESLAGRFFLHRCPHWSWPECRAAFGWTLDQWLYYQARGILRPPGHRVVPIGPPGCVISAGYWHPAGQGAEELQSQGV